MMEEHQSSLHPPLLSREDGGEETAEELSAATRADLEHHGRPVLWHAAGKYALYLHELDAADADRSGAATEHRDQ